MGIEITEDLSKIPNLLALRAARLLQSRQTGFVHHCYQSSILEKRDTIPIFENFCFVLSLLRSKSIENITEAKRLLSKLIAFEVEGDFPLYLHDYPLCQSPSLVAHLLPVLYRILQEGEKTLGTDLKSQVEPLYHRCLDSCSKRGSLSPNASWKYFALTNRFDGARLHPKTAREWSDFLIACQIAGQDPKEVFSVWHPKLCTFIGAGGQNRARLHPEATLLDLFMGQASGGFSKRALQDQPVHLHASQVYPLNRSPNAVSNCEVPYLHQDEAHHFSFLCGDEGQLHTLVCPKKSALMQMDGKRGFLFTLPESPPSEKEDPLEITLFFERHPNNSIFVSGKKATTFRLGDLLNIRLGEERLTLQFEKTDGEGDFLGHIFLGNRPSQTACRFDDKFESFDWQIALRTIRRNGPCQIRLTLESP